MLTQKENYLNIQYERGRGLKLNWNFKDIMGREKYFRHLLVIVDHEKQFVSSFVQTFYKKMKYGDILSCIHMTNQKQVKLCDWVEKTHINKFKLTTYLRDVSSSILDQKSKRDLMNRAAMETSQNHDFMVVNVLMPDRDPFLLYKSIVEQCRSKRGEFNYIVNLFSRIGENRISFYRGINTFRISPETMNQYMHFYHTFINSAVMPYASIKIECLNGQIGLFNEFRWKNVEFNTIQTMLYGPSSQFTSDQLLFYIQDLTRQMEIYLQITLNVKLFTLKKYETVKKMHLTYCYEKDGSLTMHEIKCPKFKIYKSIYLEDDPYQSTTVVRLYHNLDHSNQSYISIL